MPGVPLVIEGRVTGNDVDPFIHRSLIMAVEGTDASKRAHFDFVLNRA
jgi:hypothetical protein